MIVGVWKKGRVQEPAPTAPIRIDFHDAMDLIDEMAMVAWDRDMSDVRLELDMIEGFSLPLRFCFERDGWAAGPDESWYVYTGARGNVIAYWDDTKLCWTPFSNAS